MNQFIDDFYDVLFKPWKGITRVAAERSVWQGLIVFIAVNLVSTFSAWGGADRQELFFELSQFLPQQAVLLFMNSLPALSLISILVFSPLLLFASAALLQFASELLGGRGYGLNLASAIGYAQLPYLLVTPFSLLSRYTTFDIVGLVGFIAFLWSLFLKIEAIRAVHGFSRRRSILAFFLPALALFFAVIIFLLLVSTFLMPLLAELFPLQ